ncbi:VOC family protein [Alteromonas flava]|uniref:VOC family protein n=1 Tax=Alteromonas flava TaxID=2048003 RepID=UPI0013DABC89|nr:VOC family protein [Alteromonas flava]
MTKQTIGSMGWLDVTVENATEVKDFYTQVVGWEAEGLSMGDYEDYMMKAAGESIAGICHKRGSNAQMPSHWIPYFVIADLAVALQNVKELGGVQLSPVRSYGDSSFAIIKDPAGAVCALYQE